METIQIVPQPDLSGATDQISVEEVELRLHRKAEELRSDLSLTEVGTTTHLAHGQLSDTLTFVTARVDKSVGIMDIIKSLKTCRLLNKNSYQKFTFC